MAHLQRLCGSGPHLVYVRGGVYARSSWCVRSQRHRCDYYPHFGGGDRHLRGQHLRTDRIRSLAQDCLTWNPYLSHHSIWGGILGCLGPEPHSRRAAWTRPSRFGQANGLAEELGGPHLRRGTGESRVWQEQKTCSLPALLLQFLVLKPKQLNNLHHRLLQS